MVRRTIAALPADLRHHAESVPVFFEDEIAEHWLEDGVTDDSLGLFSGPALDEPVDPDCFESPRITLFLNPLWDFAEEDPFAFEEEVRITYIHEFGHYLGLDEDELDARGLL